MTTSRKSRDTLPQAKWLGDQVKTRRRGRFSLETLAQKAGVSAGLLSEIERGIGNPSFTTLLKLAEALEMEPADFFRFTEVPWHDEHVVRRADRQRMTMPDGRVIELLSPRTDLPVVMWATAYPKGFDGRERPLTIGAETSLLLARGTLVVPDVNGREWTIASGDTVRLEAGIQFCPVNRGDGTAETVEASTDSPL